MHNNIGTLEVNQMHKMSIDDIVSMCRQGYRLEEFYPNMDKILLYSPRREYEFMSPATCPTGGIVQKGSTKNIKVEVKATNPGTPPYTFKLERDDTEIYTYTGGATEISKTFSHTFNEALGTYTYKGFVTDSCPTGAITSNIDSCSVTVIAPAHIIAKTIVSNKYACTAPCSLIVDVTWENTGDVAGNFVPAIFVDSTRYELSQESLAGGATSTVKTFAVSNLTVAEHTICPDPS